MNTSASGGILQADSSPADDDALDAIFQSLVSEITGLDGSLVRPRWAAQPAKQPEPSVDWCAIGVLSADPDAGPWIAYQSALDNSIYYRHEALEVLASFYGPHAKQSAASLRDGLSIPQNFGTLVPYTIGFVASGVIRNIPELINQQWVKRSDMLLSFRRKVTRTYGIKSIRSANIHLIDDTVVDALISVSPPLP